MDRQSLLGKVDVLKLPSINQSINQTFNVNCAIKNYLKDLQCKKESIESSLNKLFYCIAHC